MNIDITELLEDYVSLLEKGGIPRESSESRLMLEAKDEIHRLRERLSFQIKLADDHNKSRLRLLDVIGNCMGLYESTCKRIREETGESYVCGMCLYDCDHGLNGDANECPGFDENDCFQLNTDKFRKIVFKKKDSAKTDFGEE